jgi:transcriptional regulator with XRE-family HTH domain
MLQKNLCTLYGVTMKPHQIRAARALLDWSRDTLAGKVGISVNALLRIETGKSDPKTSTMDGIRAALEAAGVDFIGEAGVTLRAKP